MEAINITDPSAWAALESWLWGSALAILVGASAIGALEARGQRGPRWSLALSALGCAVILALGVALVAGTATFSASAGSVIGFTPIDVRYDALAGIFVTALGVVGFAASVAARDGVRDTPANATTGAAYPVFLLSMLLVFGSADGFAFLLAWELMALSSAALVIGARPTTEQVRAGYLYIAVTHLATAALIVAFAVLAAAAGGSLAFAAWPAAAAGLAPLGRDAVFVLLVLGFGTKAGAIPFHAWLPRAHPAAPSHVSAVMSGVMIKAGIFGLVRVALGVLGPGPDGWGLTLLAIGAVSAVLGVLYALMEHDLKRLLAFHSIENIGIILLGLGSAFVLASNHQASLAALGLSAALFHSLNHGLFKSLLFLGAGAVQHAVGHRDLNRLGGLIRVMPLAALFFGVGAAAISGLPPLNGFASEWLTFQSLIGTGGSPAVPPVARAASLLAVGGLALTTALALACFVKATGMTFLALPRSPAAAAAHPSGAAELSAMGLLAALCVGAGLLAGPIASRLLAISATLLASPVVPASPITLLPQTPPGAGTVAPLALGVLALAAIGVCLTAVRGMGRPRVVRKAPTWTTRDLAGGGHGIHRDELHEADPAVLPAHPAAGAPRSTRPTCRVRRPQPDRVPLPGQPCPGRAGLPPAPYGLGPRRRAGPATPERQPAGLPGLHDRRGAGAAGPGGRPWLARMMLADPIVTIVLIAFQAVLLLCMAPLVAGTIRATKARLQSRRGPSVWQPYRDLRKLWLKSTVESSIASPIQAVAPAAVLGAIVAAAAIVPSAAVRPPLDGWGDLIALVGLLAAARFVIALAALDAGSAFGGMAQQSRGGDRRPDRARARARTGRGGARSRID